MSSLSVSSRRSFLGGSTALAGTALTIGPGGADAREGVDGPWSIELFTSQGCSSCPPADTLLGKFARRSNIVALSFHVDYWDYNGWKDPFATRETSERQRGYARVLKQRYVYTPEMVVDGIGHDPGTKRAPIEALLAEAKRRSPRRATPQLARAADGTLTIRLAEFELAAGPAEVTLAVYDRRHSTPVPSGENNGRMLDNFNVVRRLEKIASWHGGAKSWKVSPDRFAPGQGMAVLVQVADHGPVLGCNKLEPMVTG